jgi:hypothetical protein
LSKEREKEKKKVTSESRARVIIKVGREATADQEYANKTSQVPDTR